MVPLVNFLGALFVELLNLVFPKPPFPPAAATYSSPSLLKSKRRVLLSSSNTCVPRGTFKIKSSPPFPVLFGFDQNHFLHVQLCGVVDIDNQ